jgi:hypothetical protein
MSYELPPLGSHRIPLDEAKAMAIRYQENMDDILKPELLAKNILPISETFRKDAFLEYLSKDFVHAFRIYYGMKPDLTIHAILVGVDQDGKDILPDPIVNPGPGHPNPPGDGNVGEIFEDATRCPTLCPPEGPCLNSK